MVEMRRRRLRRPSAAPAAFAVAAVCIAGIAATAGVAFCSASARIGASRGAGEQSIQRLQRSGVYMQAAKGFGFDPVAVDVTADVPLLDPRPADDGKSQLTIKALPKGGFFMNMGGMRLLINPNLEGCTDIPPEKVHELVDYVIITSPNENSLHIPTITKMSLMRVNFVANAPAGEILERMMVRNLAVLAQGPGGRVMLTSDDTGSVPVGCLIAPGANGPFPWSPPESGFIFVNMKTGICLAYEAMGQFLGPDARSSQPDIPEEAYLADYLVTPNLRLAEGTCKGLTDKGGQLRGVIHVPMGGTTGEEIGEDKLLEVVVALDKALGGEGAPESGSAKEFNAFLAKSKGTPLEKTRLVQPTPGGDFELLEK